MSHTVPLESLPAPLRDLVAAIGRDGGEIVVTEAGRPVARVVADPPRRQSGMDAGLVWMSPDFDAPDPAFEDLFERDL